MTRTRLFINPILNDGQDIQEVVAAVQRTLPEFELEESHNANTDKDGWTAGAHLRGLFVMTQYWETTARVIMDGLPAMRGATVILSGLTAPLPSGDHQAAMKATHGSFVRFTCARCRKLQELFHTGYSVSPGYGWYKPKEDEPAELHCYLCCAEVDQDDMDRTGKTVLYLDAKAREVINWPGSLRLRVITLSYTEQKRLARVTFRDRHGKLWDGQQTVADSDLINCKRK